MVKPINSDEWVAPEPEEIEEAREAARPGDSGACMEMGQALLETRDSTMRREAVLWHAQAALLEEPVACFPTRRGCGASGGDVCARARAFERRRLRSG